MKSLRSQLLVSHILPLVILLPLLGLILLYVIETQVLLAGLTEDLARQATFLAELAAEQQDIFVNRDEGESFARETGAQSQRYVSLYGADGNEWVVVVEDDAPDAAEPSATELEALKVGRVQTRAVLSVDLAQTTAEAFAPVLNAQQRLIGIVRVTEHIDRVNARLTQIRLLILGSTLGALVLAVGLGTYLARRTSQRLERVTYAIGGLAHGEPISEATERMPIEFRAAFDAVGDLQTRLRESEETRKRLLANLVHELGRPLGALQAAIHALQQGADREPALREELLQGMDGQVERLKPLLDNLASLHGGLSSALTLHRAPTDLNTWLPQILVGWREAAEQKHLAWVEEIQPNLPPVNMDANRMAQVIGNLLSNAIKYTPEGSGKIRVLAERRDNEILIAIHDTGVGISQQDMEQIFDPFYRGQNARFPQGMGLGLAIAREIVDAHGGRLCAVSELGTGSRFEVFLGL